MNQSSFSISVSLTIMLSVSSLSRVFVLFQVLVACVVGQNAAQPYRIGYILFPGFELFDVYAPLSALNLMSFSRNFNLTLIADTLDAVTQKGSMVNTSNSTFGAYFLPTHTFANAPELDVLIVPGGVGTRAPAPALDSAIAFVKERYPSLKYLITICTGAGVAARAGVLDGKYATTNKRAWAQTTALGPNVNWVAVARWVVDGNIWSSSGVSAGVDVVVAWLAHMYGDVAAQTIADGMEYTRHNVSTVDPFAALYNLTDANSTHPHPHPRPHPARATL